MKTNDFVVKKGTAKTMPVALTLEHVSPVTRLLEKRKQMLEVQKSLDAQKDEYQRKEELFKRREENLRKKDLELQEALVLFNKFLKENEHKRRRAEHRALEEVKKRNKWEKEIAVKIENLEKLKLKRNKLQEQLAKNEKYQMFLNLVLEQHSNHFDEIPVIITRHTTLEEANQDLKAKQEESSKKSENLRQEFQEKQKNQYNQILELNNSIATKSKILEDKAQDAAKKQELHVDEENRQTERKTETTKIIMAVENLQSRCKKALTAQIKHGRRLTKEEKQKKKKEEEGLDEMEIKQRETCEKLEVIGNYLLDFALMVKQINTERKQQEAQSQALSQTTGGGALATRPLAPVAK